jgi:hypothetical protein
MMRALTCPPSARRGSAADGGRVTRASCKRFMARCGIVIDCCDRIMACRKRFMARCKRVMARLVRAMTCGGSIRRRRGIPWGTGMAWNRGVTRDRATTLRPAGAAACSSWQLS